MRILITGGSGHVGRRVVALLSSDHDVLNLDLREPPEGPSGHVSGDILDAESVRAAMRSVDAVVHTAAIPGPMFGSLDDIYMTNTEGTRRVAAAAFAAGIRRFVNVSSEAVLGFVFGQGGVKPRYFPVDEDHKLTPTDAYGRSKLVAEQSLSEDRPPDSVVVSLRPPWVWVPEEYAQCRRLTHDPEGWAGGLWAYIHGDDLAAAVKLAVERDLAPAHYPVFVAAEDNGTIFATRKLVEKFYPQVTVRSGISEYGSLISTREASRILGFAPTLRWRGFLE
ncbi:MAG: NAD(P)-dependent oxidoreductase [Candidatus Eisenbacteria bacterium]